MQEIIKIFHFSIDRSFFGAYHNGCKKCIGKKAVSYTHLDVYKRQLVNNAAVGRSSKRLEEETLGEWNSILGTNLTGTFLTVSYTHLYCEK